MAVGTIAAIGLGISAASAAVNTGMSLSQASEGRRRQREAESDLDNYQRQQLTNAYANMNVPMEGYRMQQSGIQQNFADVAGSLAMTGARGVVGGSQALMSQTDLAMQKVRADLEESQMRIKSMVAEDEARIRGMQEAREQADITGLGQEIQAGRQQYYQGIEGATSSIGQLGGSLYSMGGSGGGTSTGVGSIGSSLNKYDLKTPDLSSTSLSRYNIGGGIK